MGSRLISLDPATMKFGCTGSIVIEVSLCGPSSLETSTFAPTVGDELHVGELGPLVCFSSVWYLAHQVGTAAAGAGVADASTGTIAAPMAKVRPHTTARERRRRATRGPNWILLVGHAPRDEAIVELAAIEVQ